MKNLFLALSVSSLFLALGEEYKTEKAGPPPAAASSLVKAEGVKVSAANGKTLCEIWMRNPIPTGPKSTEPLLTLPEIPHGAFLGVIHFPATYKDRRGQTIKAGMYTLRYSFYPQNGDHQGVAPQRDFLLLTPMSEDKDLESKPTFDALMEMSRKASGTPHPAVYSFWKEEEGFTPGIRQLGEHDWVLYTELAGLKLAIILVGQAEA
jgi:hypothetical protein